MADPNIADYALKAAGVAGGGGALTLLIYGIGQLLRGWQSGAGAQEKEMREALAERLAILEEKVEHLEFRLNRMTRQRDDWRWMAMGARIIAERLASKHGEQLDPWPTDPPEPPQGATP
ncbi:hypothetical protein [Deinococcus altitudinis]|uniref:hypothetical protein n=1 Tax=Deinococcus altitudinis TaxID=468914 RepID=UPI003892C566